MGSVVYGSLSLFCVFCFVISGKVLGFYVRFQLLVIAQSDIGHNTGGHFIFGSFIQSIDNHYLLYLYQ